MTDREQSEAWERRQLWRAAKTVGWRLRRRGILRWLAPVDYTRCREIPCLLSLLDRRLLAGGGDVLDLASPQILSVSLAARHRESRFVYLNPFAPERDEMETQLAAAGLASVRVVDGDGRVASLFKPETFDIVMSCSVLEHIVDIDGEPGDGRCIANAGRWLKSGGQLLLSVPFHSRGFDEFREAPVYADAAGQPGRYFFQRFYDPESLGRRLLRPSGLAVERVFYLGERWYHEGNIHRRVAHRLSTRWPRAILGRFFPLLSRVFLERAEDCRSLRKPYLAIVALRKP